MQYNGVKRYLLVKPALVIRTVQVKGAFVAPEGTLVTLLGPALNGRRLVDVLCQEQTVMMFSADLLTRAEEVHGETDDGAAE
jgi:hypothetical protein